MGQLEQSRFGGIGAAEGAPLVAEQFAFQKLFGSAAQLKSTQGLPARPE